MENFQKHLFKQDRIIASRVEKNIEIQQAGLSDSEETKGGFIYTFWYSLSSTSLILE